MRSDMLLVRKSFHRTGISSIQFRQRGGNAGRVDAIDILTNSFWVDDNHGEEALAILAARGSADRAIETNIDRDPDALLRAMMQLAEAAANSATS